MEAKKLNHSSLDLLQSLLDEDGRTNINIMSGHTLSTPNSIITILEVTHPTLPPDPERAVAEALYQEDSAYVHVVFLANYDFIVIYEEK